MKHTNRNIWQWSLGLILFGNLAFCMGFQPRHLELMAKAKRITAINTETFPLCAWVSDHEVIFPIYREEGKRFEFARRNTSTGIQTSLDILNTKYKALLHERDDFVPITSGPSHRVVHLAPYYSISTNRKCLLFPYTRVEGSSDVVNIATTLDGTKEVRWLPEHSDDSSFGQFWLHDNHRILELTVTQTDEALSASMVLRDLNKPAEVKTMPIGKLDTPVNPLGLTSDERLLIAHNFDSEAAVTSVKLTDYGIVSPSTDVHHYTVRLPVPAFVHGIILSPHGDRLVWRLEFDVPSAPSQPSATPLQPKRRMGLWASNLDGSNMTEIGSKLLLPEDKDGEGIHNLQWFPNNRGVSFVFQGSLYTVPVPAQVLQPNTPPVSVKCSLMSGFGSGYSWSLEVKADGTAHLSLLGYPKKKQRQWKITPAQLAELNRVIDAERFFELENEYGDQVPDSSSRTLSIVRGNDRKTVKLNFLRTTDAKLPQIKRAIHVWNTIRQWFNDAGAIDLRPYDQRLLDAR